MKKPTISRITGAGWGCVACACCIACALSALQMNHLAALDMFG